MHYDIYPPEIQSVFEARRGTTAPGEEAVYTSLKVLDFTSMTPLQKREDKNRPKWTLLNQRKV